MNVKERFHSDIIRFGVDGISMIGNNRTGALIGLDNDGAAFVGEIFNNNSPLVSVNVEPLYAALKRGNFFVEEPESENMIMSAYFHVTDRCNFHCLGCYSYVCKRNENMDLTLEQIQHELNELAENGVKGIVISGGEPFIREDIASICEYAKGLNISTRIITNGTMPHERYKKALPYIDAISVSVDGYSEDVSFIRDKGTMPRVLATVKYLKELGAKVNLIFTLHHKNAVYLNRYKELAETLGTTYNFSILTTALNDMTFKDYILTKDDFKCVEEFLNQNNVAVMDSAMETKRLCCKSRCGAGKLLISIAADGSVYPCHMLHVKGLKLGNVLNEKLRRIVFSKNNPFLDLDIKKINGCSSCKYGNFCGGGCRARSYLSTGSLYDNSDICDVSYKNLEKQFSGLRKAYGV